ncbi:hypothetical protein [Paracoccus sp. PAR01]|uniref:hypothetical protein n=1 Tax=Paracoccus sp. PAR01 TaxID=2769282 RepID=UPI00177FA326|nr:hypothetical protein [Paracoccus sp. PAR01]MBD9528409.1 hypothetical protein [Paracoccus sp. PAR01]
MHQPRFTATPAPIPVYDACPADAAPGFGYIAPDPIPSLRRIIIAVAIVIAAVNWGGHIASMLFRAIGGAL